MHELCSDFQYLSRVYACSPATSDADAVVPSSLSSLGFDLSLDEQEAVPAETLLRVEDDSKPGLVGTQEESDFDCEDDFESEGVMEFTEEPVFR